MIKTTLDLLYTDIWACNMAVYTLGYTSSSLLQSAKFEKDWRLMCKAIYMNKETIKYFIIF